MGETSFDDFLKVDVRVGRVTRADPFPEARKPASKPWIDFGPGIGERTPSAQFTTRYAPEALVGRQLIAVVNLPPRHMGPLRSEILTVGLPDADHTVVLVRSDRPAADGARPH